MKNPVKIVVVSDNHGMVEPIDYVRETHRDCDYFIHCGDADMPSYLLDGFAVVQGNNATTLIVRNGSVERKELSDGEVELLRIFEALDVKGRTALLSAAFDLEERIPPKEGD